MIQRALSLFWNQDKIHPIFPLCMEGAGRKIIQSHGEMLMGFLATEGFGKRALSCVGSGTSRRGLSPCSNRSRIG